MNQSPQSNTVNTRDQAAVLAPGLVTDQWFKAEPKWFTAKLISGVIATIIIGVLAAIPYFIWGFGWLLIFPGIIFVLFVGSLPFEYFEVRNHAVLLRQDEILLREGSLAKTVRAVPFGRIQYVDLEEGPIDAKYGLAKVEIKSAATSGGVHVKGIPVQFAHQLRDHVLAAAEVRRVEL